MDKEIISFTADYQNEDISDLEKLRVKDIEEKLKDVKEKESVEEAFILQTCNRVEQYILTSDQAPYRLQDDGFDERSTQESIEHLMRVACGLESAIIGEDEILGQIKDAREKAKDIGLEDGMLKKTVDKAIQTGKKVREKTEINEGERSIVSITATTAQKNMENEDFTAMIIGLGDIGRDLLNYLEADEIVLGVRDRHGANFEGDYKVFETSEALNRLDEVDVLFTATSSDEYVIHDVRLPELAFDLANPRDIDPELEEDSEIWNLDRLNNKARKNMDSRKEEIEEVDSIIEEELMRLEKEYRHMKADDAIATINSKSQRLKEQKLEELFSRLDEVDKDTEQHIRSMADSLVRNLMAAPTMSLKRAAEQEDWETLQTAVEVFGKGSIGGKESGEETGSKVI